MQLTTVQQVVDGVWPKGGVQMGRGVGVFSRICPAAFLCVIVWLALRIDGHLPCVSLVAPHPKEGLIQSLGPQAPKNHSQ